MCKIGAILQWYHLLLWHEGDPYANHIFQIIFRPKWRHLKALHTHQSILSQSRMSIYFCAGPYENSKHWAELFHNFRRCRFYDRRILYTFLFELYALIILTSTLVLRMNSLYWFWGKRSELDSKCRYQRGINEKQMTKSWIIQLHKGTYKVKRMLNLKIKLTEKSVKDIYLY